MSSCGRNTVAMVINGLAKDFRDEREVGDYRITKFGGAPDPPPSPRLLPDGSFVFIFGSMSRSGV